MKWWHDLIVLSIDKSFSSTNEKILDGLEFTDRLLFAS
jgi:hypothetical protein